MTNFHFAPPELPEKNRMQSELADGRAPLQQLRKQTYLYQDGVINLVFVVETSSLLSSPRS